jgi:hypothetical protein
VPHGAPSIANRVLELRAPFEFGAFVAAAPLLRMMPRGEPHPVLVLPGFTAGDRSTGPLRTFLSSMGYPVYGWGLGTNIGPTDQVVRRLPERLDAVQAEHGRAVSLVGWSLGGIYARELARMAPDRIRQVLTLGSPINLASHDGTHASRLYDAFAPVHSARTHRRFPRELEDESLPVPATAVYSRTDGVVPWQSCVQIEDDRHENVEVHGSHVGLGHNPAVLVVIADRLSLPEGTWRPFRPARALSLLYPSR